MSAKVCEICNERKSGMSYGVRALCFPCRDLAVEYYFANRERFYA